MLKFQQNRYFSAEEKRQIDLKCLKIKEGKEMKNISKKIAFAAEFSATKAIRFCRVCETICPLGYLYRNHPDYNRRPRLYNYSVFLRVVRIFCCDL